MWLTNLSIRRPVFILMLMLVFVVLGFYSYTKMKTELQPPIDFPFITIITTYPGAGPEEIETQISKPVEDAISGVSGIQQVNSTSREGMSIVSVEFDLATKIDTAFIDVRSKVDAIRSQLPKDALSPVISKLDLRATPIMYIGVSSQRPSVELRDIADNIFKDRLSRAPGVASVTISGGDQREILVALKPERLIAFGLSPSDVLAQIQAATLNIPAGRIVEDPKEYAIRFYGEFRSVEELQKLNITVDKDEKSEVVPLASIADVKDTIAETRVKNRLDKANTMSLIIQKSSEANTVEVAEKIKEQLAVLQKDYPDIKFIISDDDSILIEESLADLRVSLILGVILVILIIFMFLHNMRGTLIVAIAIPTSFFATFIVMNFMGLSVNSMTMLGLSLAVGILVDDAIVVLENIYRHLTMGEPPEEAALNGRSEIGLAAITITMVDVVVFLPIAFMGGISGKFFYQFGITVATATLFSLLVSFTVTPMLASRWYKRGEDFESKKGFFLWFEKNYKKLENAYRAGLSWALDHRWMVILIGNGVLLFIVNLMSGSTMKIAAALGASVMSLLVPWGFIAILFFIAFVITKKKYLYKASLGFTALSVAITLATVLGSLYGTAAGRSLLAFRFFSEQDTGNVVVKITMPPGSSLATTDDIAKQIEEVIMKNPDVKHCNATIGNTASGFFGGGDSGSRYAELQVTLNDKMAFFDKIFSVFKKSDMRQKSDKDIAQILNKEIGTYPGVKLSVAAQEGSGGGGAPIQIAFQGSNIDELTDTATKAMAVISKIDGVIDPDLSVTLGQPEYRALVDRQRATDMDISPARIASSLRIAYEGNNDTKFREKGREYPIRVRLEDNSRNDLLKLKQVPVAFVRGNPVWLDSVTTIELRSAPTKIERSDRNRQVVLTAYLVPGKSTGNIAQEVDQKLAEANLPPPGIIKQWRGESLIMARESVYMLQAILLSLILVYILMASLFDNLLTPFVIMLAQPQAMIGALLGLILANSILNIVSMIGIIMLIGLVGKNAILLIDYTRTLILRGYQRREAILEAGPIRLRPIMMTTLAMILGTLPIALAIGRGSEFRAPLGIAVIGGLLVSTLLTLFVIPCSFTIVDDFSNWLSRVVFRHKPTPPEA